MRGGAPDPSARRPPATAPASSIEIREARGDDLPAIVALFAEDELGGHGDAWEEGTRGAYERAFAAIAHHPSTALYAAVENGAVVGTFQLTLTPGLAGRGAVRASVEGVQVRGDRRSRGIGAAMLRFAEAFARAHGASSLALTSNKRRADAHRFYERAGYARSHEGFKKQL